MSDIRFNQWLHQSGTGGVTQLSSGHVGIGTTNPLIPVHSGNNAVLNVGVVTANNIYAGTLNGTLALSDISGITGSFTSDLTVNGPNLDISDKIRHIGDTNTAIRFPANDNISFETNGNERVRILSSGLAVGINAMVSGRPDNVLHLHKASSGTADGPTIYFTNQQTGVTGSDGFTVGIDDAQSPYLWNRENTALRFGTNNNERLRIGSSGQFGIGGANYGTAGQVLTSQGSGSAVQWATPSSITTAGGTMTIGFQDHVSGNTSSTTPTAYYQRIGNMVFCSVDTGAINLSGLNNGEILLVTGCFPVTRDNNWDMCGSAYQYTVNSAQNGGGPVIVPTMGYWLSNTSLYFVIPRNNSTADNLTVGMCNSNNTRIFMQWSYKVN